MKNPFYFLVLVSTTLTFTACSTIMNNIPGVYTLDIQQGNLINQDMIDQLKPQMTKRQILYIMGSSMLIDVFHQQRWDYIYSEKLDGEPRKQKRLSLFFKDDLLLGIQGDFRPSALPVAKKSYETTIEIPPRDLEKTLWEKITGLFKDENPESESITKKKSMEAITQTIEDKTQF